MFLLLLACLGCGLVADLARGPVTADELERLCRIAGEVDRRGMVPEERVKAIAGRLEDERLDALLELWRALQAAPPKVRRKLYDESLEAAGLADFECRPLERALLGR